jgi:hypothetical protein
MLRAADKCALDTCDLRWQPGIAFIRDNYTHRYCSEDHQAVGLSGLPWPKALFSDAPEALDEQG